MDLSIYSDDHYMKQALIEAELAYEEKEIPIAKSCSIEHFILLIPAGQFPLTSQNIGMKLHVLQYTMNIESIPNGSLLDEKMHVPLKSYLLKL